MLQFHGGGLNSTVRARFERAIYFLKRNDQENKNLRTHHMEATLLDKLFKRCIFCVASRSTIRFHADYGKFLRGG